MSQLSRLRAPVRELAGCLSLAAHVDRALVRQMRLTLFRKLDARVEAELWFSPIVIARDADAIQLALSALAELREELRVKRQQLAAAREVVRTVHARAAPTLRLEEEVIWLSVSGASPATINDALGRAVAAMAERPRAVARWAAHAIPRFPENARTTPSAWALALGASTQLTTTNLVVDSSVPTEAFKWSAPLLSSSTAKITIGIRLVPTGLEIGPPGADNAHELQVPATNPCLLELEWGPAHATVSRSVAIQPNELHFEVGPYGVVRVHTLCGDRFELRPSLQANSADVSGSEALETADAAPRASEVAPFGREAASPFTSAQEEALAFVSDPELKAQLRTGKVIACVRVSKYTPRDALNRLVRLPVEHIIAIESYDANAGIDRIMTEHRRVFDRDENARYLAGLQEILASIEGANSRLYLEAPEFGETPDLRNEADTLTQILSHLNVPILLIGFTRFDRIAEDSDQRFSYSIPPRDFSARPAPTFAIAPPGTVVRGLKVVSDFLGWLQEEKNRDASVRCFIASDYSDHESPKHLRPLLRALIDSGAFIIPRDLQPSEDWKRSSERRIRKADVFFAVRSGGTSAGLLQHDLEIGVEQAARTGKPRIVPVSLGNQAMTEVPTELHTLQEIVWNGPEDDQRLYSQIAALLEEMRQGNSTAPTPLEPEAGPDWHFLSESELEVWLESRGRLSPGPIIACRCIFATSKQQTWLVTLPNRVLCLLDDANTRTKQEIVQFNVRPEELEPVHVVREDSTATGALLMGKRRYLFSLQLFPRPAELEQTVMNLLAHARAAAASAPYRSVALLAREYDVIRNADQYSDKRTDAMITVRNNMERATSALNADQATELFDIGLDGSRLAALVFAETSGRSACLPFVLEALHSPRSGFETFHAVWAAGALFENLTQDDARQLVMVATRILREGRFEPKGLEDHVPWFLEALQQAISPPT